MLQSKGSGCYPAVDMPRNLVWVIADDFAPRISRPYGGRWASTPVMDALADDGWLFEEAFCTCPLSTPSNQSSWAGQYPRTVGVTLSPTPLPDATVTIDRHLKQHGYEVAAVGKTHYYAPREDDFDYVIERRHHQQWLQSKGPDPIPPELEVLGPWRPFRTPAAQWLNATALPFGATDRDMQSTFYANRAAEYLTRRARPPFFLHVGLCETHSPFRVPIEFRNRRLFDIFPVPTVPASERATVPAVFAELTEQDKQGISAAYTAAVEYLDRNIGIVLQGLADSGHADDTMVVFSSDHGYLLGEHGRFEKHCCYEEAIRVALIVRAPGLGPAGQRVSAMVQLIDVLPTVLEALRIPVPPSVQGRSLLPLLRGHTDHHRDQVFIEYSDNAEAAVRTARYKLIYSSGGRHRLDGYAPDGGPRSTLQLFDLEADPTEHRDLSDIPEHRDTLNTLIRALLEHLEATAPTEINTTVGGGLGASLEERLRRAVLPVEVRR